jgi:hypothetical protein
VRPAASARDGDLDQLLAGWAAALRMMPGALLRRRAVRAMRRVRPCDVEALMIAGPPAGTGMRRRLLFEIAPDRAQKALANRSQGA